MSYLLDTMVISELNKEHPDASVSAWIDEFSHTEIFISIFTLGELWRGAIELVRRHPYDSRRVKKAVDLMLWIQSIENNFRENIIPKKASHWGEISAAWEEVKDAWKKTRGNNNVPGVDSMIVATAKAHGMKIVTRNRRHMSGLGVPVIDPWQEPYPFNDDPG